MSPNRREHGEKLFGFFSFPFCYLFIFLSFTLFVFLYYTLKSKYVEVVVSFYSFEIKYLPHHDELSFCRKILSVAQKIFSSLLRLIFYFKFQIVDFCLNFYLGYFSSRLPIITGSFYLFFVVHNNCTFIKELLTVTGRRNVTCIGFLGQPYQVNYCVKFSVSLISKQFYVELATLYSKFSWKSCQFRFR